MPSNVEVINIFGLVVFLGSGFNFQWFRLEYSSRLRVGPYIVVETSALIKYHSRGSVVIQNQPMKRRRSRRDVKVEIIEWTADQWTLGRVGKGTLQRIEVDWHEVACFKLCSSRAFIFTLLSCQCPYGLIALFYLLHYQTFFRKTTPWTSFWSDNL